MAARAVLDPGAAPRNGLTQIGVEWVDARGERTEDVVAD